jgi:AraC-like DNA-binding protein
MGSSDESLPHQFTSRIKATVLRRLTTAPLSEWPQALVECLDTLSAFGVSRRTAHPASPSPASVSTTRVDAIRSPHVRRACAYIRTHYGERISLDSLATLVGRNTAYLATLFRRQTGMTIHRYLTGIRMQRAARLLRQCEKVEAVMLLVGYRSKKNFYRQFAAAFGVTPGQYKANAVARAQMPRGGGPASRA